jgi:molybdopterin converting factor small subunit
MTIEVRLFAGVREACGVDSLRVVVEGERTVLGLKKAIVSMHEEIGPLIAASRIAVGNAFVEDEDRLEIVLEAGKTIALIPPVSGG